MSEHDIEAAFEICVQNIGLSNLPETEKRAISATMFSGVKGSLASYFDIGWTLTRTTKELKQASYLFSMPRSELDLFMGEKLHDDYGWVHLGKTAIGTVQNGQVFYEAGGVLWQRMVAAKKLSGLAAEPVVIVQPLQKFLVQIGEVFTTQTSISGLGGWYHVVSRLSFLKEFEPKPGDIEWQKVRHLFGNTHILKTYLAIEDNELEDLFAAIDEGDFPLEDMPKGLKWWLEPALKLHKR